jgi:pilus assembly protein Flp/PilA
METVMRRLRAFLWGENGAAAIEYGLIAAGIAVAIIVAVNSVGSQLDNTFNAVSNDLSSAGQ